MISHEALATTRLLALHLAFQVALTSSLSAEGYEQADFQPEIPKVWDEQEVHDLELPLAQPEYSPTHISPEYYYSMPVRPIYESYPVYHPDEEPEGYFQWLQKQEPDVIWDGKENRPELNTRQDWIEAGEIVFDSPIIYDASNFVPSGPDNHPFGDRQWFQEVAPPVTTEGKLPFYRYVIREQGKVEVGVLSCAMCHTRVTPDGTAIKGAQGNFPFNKSMAYGYRQEQSNLKDARELERELYAAPWIEGDHQEKLDEMSKEEIAAPHDRIPPGLLARRGSGVVNPVQIPSLIGLEDRRYFDHTGLVRHDGIGDLMRYASLNQDVDFLSKYGDFRPVSVRTGDGFPDPEEEDRYSDEQLYALSLYLYSLEPPENPNKPNELSERGREIFERENCASCHEPPLYTNNKLVRAKGFDVPDDHPDRESVMSWRVGTDPGLATRTRRGTGFYKVPSLKGVWYRSMFGHSGWAATLEDWFDPQRTEEDYVPTGWKGPPGTEALPVKGHNYGLDLSEEERKALIAFLRTLD